MELASALQTYGPIALIPLLLLAIRFLFQKYDAAQEARIVEGKETAMALKSSTQAIIETNKLLVAYTAEVAQMKIRFEHNFGKGH